MTAPVEKPPPHGADGEVWEAHLAELDQVVRLLEGRGIPLVALTFPHLRRVAQSRGITDKVSAQLESRGVQVVNVAALLAGRDPDTTVVNALDAHPNEAVHAEVATHPARGARRTRVAPLSARFFVRGAGLGSPLRVATVRESRAAWGRRDAPPVVLVATELPDSEGANARCSAQMPGRHWRSLPGSIRMSLGPAPFEAQLRPTARLRRRERQIIVCA